ASQCALQRVHQWLLVLSCYLFLFDYGFAAGAAVGCVPWPGSASLLPGITLLVPGMPPPMPWGLYSFRGSETVIVRRSVVIWLASRRSIAGSSSEVAP